VLLGLACSGDGRALTDPANVTVNKSGGLQEDYDPQGTRSIRFTKDPDDFFARTGPLHTVTFESLPWFGTSCSPVPPFEPLANPLTVQGVVFRAPGCLESFFCPRPPCETVNMTLHLPRAGWMEFPDGVTAVLLKLEAMPAGRFVIVTEDANGGTTGYTGTLDGVAPTYVGILNDREVRAIRYHGSSSVLQKLVISELWYEGGSDPDGPTAGPIALPELASSHGF